MTTEGDSIRRTVDNLRVGFQVIGFDWRYIYANPAAAAQGNTTVDALVGRTIQDCFPGITDLELFAAFKACMEERTARLLDTLFAAPGGAERWFEVRVEPTAEGICVYSLDIHERQLWQLELEQRA